MNKSIFRSTVVTSAILNALVIALFLGSLANAPQNMDESFSGKYWHYINRGYPIPFTGWTLDGTVLEFPHVKLPFIVASGENELEKILDLTKFVPLLSIIFAASYFPAYIFEKIMREKKLLPIWTGVHAFILIIGIIMYFSWLPRI